MKACNTCNFSPTFAFQLNSFLPFNPKHIYNKKQLNQAVNQAVEKWLSESRPRQLVQPYELPGAFHSAPTGLPNAVLDLSSFVWAELFVYRFVPSDSKLK